MIKTRCGFAALIGAPNAGKSTLLNALVGEKISIVTPKVQTTRNRILGITLVKETQIILIDTPGIFMPKRRLERAMVSAAWSAPKDADIACLLVDVSKKDLSGNLEFLDKLAEKNIKPVIILNKIDLVAPSRLLEITHKLTNGRNIKETFMISALNKDGVDDFKMFLAKELPEGPWHFPEDQITDMPMRLMAAEITREKLFMSLQDELPYSLMVETDKWENFKNGDVKINQIVIVQRDGQKKIVLGKNGDLIKKVGQKSRIELEKTLGKKVHLFLHVKVRQNWIDKPGYYNDMGLDFNI